MSNSGEIVSTVKTLDRRRVHWSEIMKINNKSNFDLFKREYSWLCIIDVTTEQNCLYAINEVLKLINPYITNTKDGLIGDDLLKIVLKAVSQQTTFTHKAWVPKASQDFGVFKPTLDTNETINGMCSFNTNMYVHDSLTTGNKSGIGAKHLQLLFEVKFESSNRVFSIQDLIGFGYAKGIFKDIFTNEQCDDLERHLISTIEKKTSDAASNNILHDNKGKQFFIPISDNEYHLAYPLVHLGFRVAFSELMAAKWQRFGFSNYRLYNYRHKILGGGKNAGTAGFVPGLLSSGYVMMQSNPLNYSRMEKTTEHHAQDIIRNKSIFHRIRKSTYSNEDEKYSYVKKLSDAEKYQNANIRNMVSKIYARLVYDFMKDVDYLAEVEYSTEIHESIPLSCSKWLFPDRVGKPNSGDYNEIANILYPIVKNKMIIMIDGTQFITQGWFEDKLKEELVNYLHRN